MENSYVYHLIILELKVKVLPKRGTIIDTSGLYQSKELIDCNSGHRQTFRRSEHNEGLSDIAFDSLLLDSDDVESDGLGDWSALANDDDVAHLGSAERWRAVSWQVVVSLLESVVLFDVVQVVSSQDQSSAHLGRQHDSLEDSASDGHVRGEWALVVNVRSLNCRRWSLETYNNIIHTLYLPRPIFLMNLFPPATFLASTFFEFPKTPSCF